MRYIQPLTASSSNDDREGWKNSDSFPEPAPKRMSQVPGAAAGEPPLLVKKAYAGFRVGRVWGPSFAGEPRRPRPSGVGLRRSFEEPANNEGSNAALSGVEGIASPSWKRILDLALVLVTLPAWLLVMILVTLWIKVVSPGPTFYRQERVGYCGRKFMLLKFRSMRVNAETQAHEQHCAYLIAANAPMTKLDKKGDPRLIPGGRVIRALGLDEIPQLINVFWGEMSLVGPRPCTPSEFEHYHPWHRERVKVPPGITGFWQVNGKNRTTFNEMVAMDVFYAEHMSLFLDFEILLKTGRTVIAQALETHLRHCWS